MPDITDEAGKLISDNSRTLAPAAVGSQVALMTVVSVSRPAPDASSAISSSLDIDRHHSCLQSPTSKQQGVN